MELSLLRQSSTHPTVPHDEHRVIVPVSALHSDRILNYSQQPCATILNTPARPETTASALHQSVAKVRHVLLGLSALEIRNGDRLRALARAAFASAATAVAFAAAAAPCTAGSDSPTAQANFATQALVTGNAIAAEAATSSNCTATNVIHTSGLAAYWGGTHFCRVGK